MSLEGPAFFVTKLSRSTGQHCVAHESLVNLRFVGNKKRARATPISRRRLPARPHLFPLPSRAPHSHRTWTADGAPPRESRFRTRTIVPSSTFRESWMAFQTTYKVLRSELASSQRGCRSTGMVLKVDPMFHEYEDKSLRSSSSRQENAAFSYFTHRTWGPPFRPSLYEYL